MQMESVLEGATWMAPTSKNWSTVRDLTISATMGCLVLGPREPLVAHLGVDSVTLTISSILMGTTSGVVGMTGC